MEINKMNTYDKFIEIGNQTLQMHFRCKGQSYGIVRGIINREFPKSSKCVQHALASAYAKAATADVPDKGHVIKNETLYIYMHSCTAKQFGFVPAR